MALIAGPIQTSGYQAPDYSPVIDASLRGGMLQQQITQGAIGQVTDYFKQQGEKKKLIKQSDVQIDAALKLFPDLAPTLQGVRDQIRDENVPLNDRAAIAESVAGLINMGTNQMRFQAQQQLQQAELEARSAPSVMSAMPKPTTYKPSTIDVGGQKLYVTIGSDGYYYDPQTKTPILDLEAYARGESPEVYGGGAGMSGAEFLTEADMMLPQDGGAALMDGGVLPPPPVDSQQAAGIQSALGYSPQLAGGLPPGVEGPVIPDLTSPSASPEQIQAALDAVSPQAVAPAPAQPQVQGQLRSRLIGQEKESETRGLTEQERASANLPAGNYVGRFVNGKLVSANPVPTSADPQAVVNAARAAEVDKRALQFVSEADTIDSKISNMNAALKLLESGDVKTGTLAKYKMEAKRLLGQDVSSEEQFNSLVGNLAMEAISLTKGAISDREMQYFTEVLAPNQGKSVEGNKKILEFKLAVAKRNKKIADEVLKMFDRGENAFEVNKKITEMQDKNPLVDTAEMQSGTQMPNLQQIEEIRARRNLR